MARTGHGNDACSDDTASRLVIHIGSHKTGSTLLQLLAERNARHLERRNIAALPGGPNHSHLHHAFCERPENEHWMERNGLDGAEACAAWAKEQRAQLRQWLADRRSGGTALLTGEELSRLSATGTARLAETVGDFVAKVTILLFVRQPGPYARSRAQEDMQAGLTLTDIAADPPSFLARPVIERYRAAFGDATIVVRPYLEGPDGTAQLIADFAQAIGAEDLIEDLQADAARLDRPNAGLCDEAVRMLDHLNRHYPRLSGGRVDCAERGVPRGWLGAIRGRPFTLPSDIAGHAVERCRDDRAWLSQYSGDIRFDISDEAPSPLPAGEPDPEDFLASIAEILRLAARTADTAIGDACFQRVVRLQQEGRAGEALRFARAALTVVPSNETYQRRLREVEEAAARQPAEA